eukprot:COSAG02_NODE_9675_length_2146_cov_2.826575_3_plen_79_part_00
MPVQSRKGIHHCPIPVPAVDSVETSDRRDTAFVSVCERFCRAFLPTAAQAVLRCCEPHRDELALAVLIRTTREPAALE